MRYSNAMQLTVTVPSDRDVPESWQVVKRSIDVLLGALLMIVSAPIVALAAIAITCVTGGTPFYAQERVGMHGRRFNMYKLRTMVNGAHAMRQSVMHLNEVDGPVSRFATIRGSIR